MKMIAHPPAGKKPFALNFNCSASTFTNASGPDVMLSAVDVLAATSNNPCDSTNGCRRITACEARPCQFRALAGRRRFAMVSTVSIIDTRNANFSRSRVAPRGGRKRLRLGQVKTLLEVECHDVAREKVAADQPANLALCRR